MASMSIDAKLSDSDSDNLSWSIEACGYETQGTEQEQATFYYNFDKVETYSKRSIWKGLTAKAYTGEIYLDELMFDGWMDKKRAYYHLKAVVHTEQVLVWRALITCTLEWFKGLKHAELEGLKHLEFGVNEPSLNLWEQQSWSDESGDLFTISYYEDRYVIHSSDDNPPRLDKFISVFPGIRRDILTGNFIIVHNTETETDIGDLYDECLIKIFQYLSRYDLLHRVSLVCQRWKCIASCSQLWKTIRIDKKDKMTIPLLAELTAKHSVKHLDLMESEMNCDDLKEVLKHCEDLRTLKLPSGAGFTAVPMCKKLTTLDIDTYSCQLGSDREEDIIGRIVRECKNIKLLLLEVHTLHGVLQLIGKNCKQLKTLCVYANENGLVDDDPKDLDMHELAEGCRLLETLELIATSGCSQVRDWTVLAKLVHLKRLHLGQFDDLSHDSLKLWTQHMKCLSDFELNRCRFNILRLIEAMGSFKSLTCLFLTKQYVTDATLVRIVRSLPKLQLVDLKYCRHFSAVGLEYLASNIKSLERLTIFYAPHTRERAAVDTLKKIYSHTNVKIMDTDDILGVIFYNNYEYSGKQQDIITWKV